MKLLVAKEARELGKALGLSSTEWKFSEWGDAQTGRRFDEVVAIVPYALDAVEASMYLEYANRVLNTKLPLNKSVRYFGNLLLPVDNSNE